MLKKLTIAENILVPATWIEIETDDVLASLQQHFDKFPETARIYNGPICKINDVTPETEDDIEAIGEMEGPFFVTVSPQGTGLEIAVYALIAAIIVVALTIKPKIPTSAARNTQSSSPNNALSGRTNQIRINGRIPDIFGTVNSTPDMVAVPYTVFVDNIENEYCYMCIGRGEYAFPGAVPRIRDGQTLVSQIDGSSVEVFKPFTSPNTGDAPQIRIGDAITRKVISAVRSKSVNGQVLVAPNESAGDTGTTNYNNRVQFAFPNFMNYVAPMNDWSAIYHVGDTAYVYTSQVVRSNPVYNYTGGGDSDSGSYPVPLQGTYMVRFNKDGRMQFQSFSQVGNEGYLMGSDGWAYLEITDAHYSNGGIAVDFKGRYMGTGSGDTIQLHNPLERTTDFNLIDSYGGGGWTPYISCTFSQPSELNFNFTGEYTIDAVTSTKLTLSHPGRVNGSWAWLEHGIDLGGGDSSYGSDGDTVSIAAGSGGSGSNWVGPFTLDVTTMTEVIANFVAVQGMYKDDGTTQTSTSVSIQLGCTPCNEYDEATGVEQVFTATVVGSASKQDQRAVTLFGSVSTPGRYFVRARRITPKDITFSGNIVDEVKWRDVYASSPVGNVHFGDVTTVHSCTQATTAALAVSERQLNMLVTRKIPLWRVEGTDVTPDNRATDDAWQIFAFIAHEKTLGNLPNTSINIDQLQLTSGLVAGYFGTPKAKQFGYTFDSDNMSPEEMLQTVAQAVFCQAVRRGSVIEWLFEQDTPNSKMLFNHRNKLPDSENRSANFGNIDSFDSIEYEYVSPVDDAVVTFYVPTDRSGTRPRKIESIGVRTVEQAHLHAFREYNKLKYQYESVDFIGLQEADAIGISERILVADNTRSDTQDGEILAQTGLTLTLSQPVTFRQGVSYTIFLQHVSGNVESMDVTKSDVDDYTVVLAGTPTEPLVTDDELIAKTGYIIVPDADAGRNAFLVTAKEYPNQNNFTAKLTAINYDSRYYQNDFDYHA